MIVIPCRRDVVKKNLLVFPVNDNVSCFFFGSYTKKANGLERPQSWSSGLETCSLRKVRNFILFEIPQRIRKHWNCVGSTVHCCIVWSSCMYTADKDRSVQNLTKNRQNWQTTLFGWKMDPRSFYRNRLCMPSLVPGTKTLNLTPCAQCDWICWEITGSRNLRLFHLRLSADRSRWKFHALIYIQYASQKSDDK